jgi:hypothetical protein
MDREKLKKAISHGNIEWQRHALERMMERGITRAAVNEVLLIGEVIEDYPDDKPYPSALILGRVGEETYHVVTALDPANDWCFVITAYKPDLEHFEADFKTRRQHGN